MIIIPPESRRRPLGENAPVTHAKNKCWGEEGLLVFQPLLWRFSSPWKSTNIECGGCPPPTALITGQPFRLLTDLFVCVTVRDSIKTSMALFQARRRGCRIVTFDTDTPLQMKPCHVPFVVQPCLPFFFFFFLVSSDYVEEVTARRSNSRF